jgi:predicted AAA+ superfamily ATPase
MSVRQIPVREEILAAEYDPAPKLGEILSAVEGKPVSRNAAIMANPEEFFERTVVTDTMLDIFEKILDGYEGKNKVFLLQSFFGGGKTHTLLAIFHAFRKPEAIFKSKDLVGAKRERAERIVNRIKALRIADVICFSGDTAAYSGSPLSPTNVGDYAYRTVWGYIAHRLVKYSMIRRYDEALTAPQQDVCAKLLEGERVLFLFDEVAEYLTSFVGGEYANYAQAAVTFFEFFAKAVQNSKCVAVFTIPIEGKTVDWRFKSPVVSSLFDAVSKVAESFEPLTSGDVVEVLKRRIFKEIPKKLVDLTVQKYSEMAVNYPNYFKEEYVAELRKSYPFSPEYVKYLWRLVTDGKLQKTRDTLNITIEIVRRIHGSGGDYDVIPFWLVEPGPRMFQEYPEYRDIYIREVESVKDELQKLILKTIFLATYYYDGSPQKRNLYPSNLDIVRAVYEPRTFVRLRAKPNDVESELSRVMQSDEVVHLYYRDDRYWFWKVPSIKDLIEKRARKLKSVMDGRIYDVIKNYVEKSYRGEGFEVRKKKREKKVSERESRHGFEDLFFIETSKDYPPDDGKLRLAVILDKDFIDLAPHMLQYRDDGAERVYKNALVIVAPGRGRDLLSSDERRDYEDLIHNAAKLIACREIGEEIERDPIFEENRDVHRGMLEKEKNDTERRIYKLVVDVYSWIFCPGKEPLKVIEKQMSLADSVWSTLVLEGKVADGVDFDYFATLLRTGSLGIDIDRDDKNSWPVKKIKEWFRQNPEWPIVSEEAIEKMLKEGVRNWRIGILRGNEIFFKKVHQSLPATFDSEGAVPSSLEDKDIVLPRRRAIRMQLDLLKEEIRNEYFDHTEIIRHVIYPELGGESIPLSELESHPDWEEIFLQGVIVREVLKTAGPDLILRVYPGETVTVSEGESAKFTIVAEPERFTPEKVELILEKGGKIILSELMEKKDNKFEKLLEITPAETTEKFVLKVIADNTLKRERTITVKVRPKIRIIETSTVTKEHLGFRLLEIRKISTREVLETIRRETLLFNLKGKISGKIYCKVDEGRLTLDVDNTSVSVGVQAALELTEYGLERKIPEEFKISLEDQRITEALLTPLSKLNGKVTFVLEGEE